MIHVLGNGVTNGQLESWLMGLFALRVSGRWRDLGVARSQGRELWVGVRSMFAGVVVDVFGGFGWSSCVG